MIFENNQLRIEYIKNNDEEINDFSVDIKEFDTPDINIKYDYKKRKIVSMYIDIEEDDNEPKNHVAYKLIDLCKFEIINIFDFMIAHK